MKIFYYLLLLVVLVALYKLVPIYYKYYSVKLVCEPHVKLLQNSDEEQVRNLVKEELERFKIPKNKRKIVVTINNTRTATVKISYKDQLQLLDYYKKDFNFVIECSDSIAGRR